MPLISDYQQVKDVYREAAELGVGLPVFCTEDRETLEAILASALEFGRQIGVEDLPIIPAWTVRYPGRGQMTLVSASGNPRLGVRLMFSDLAAFMSEDSPYRKLPRAAPSRPRLPLAGRRHHGAICRRFRLDYVRCERASL